MSLQRIKSEINQEVETLFATAAVDELAGDTDAYRAKLITIAEIAELLGIKTEVSEITIELKGSSPRS